MVRFEDVVLRYGNGPEILKRVSLQFDPGSYHFLLGPSGAGKSSLLRMMFLAQRPSEGRVALFGRDVAGLSRRETALMRRRIGVVFQDFRLLDHLTARENVALPLRIGGQAALRGDKGRSERDVEELLAWVGLADHMDALPPTLSGGQQQRVAIARAVIARPSLLLADEPTGNLDDRMAVRLLYLFEELNKIGTTVVIATHNESLVRRFPHPVTRLLDGAVDTSEDTPPAGAAAGSLRGGR
ncbi:cell division ATP-binding protein FtsE [Pelagibius sp. 7325]|uniref:cell division ATP-binding protein FtsE n=1 Tax=Pelagibius sp. 7325 TaxID=3131994 RepID=UPI0030EC7B7C